MEPQAERDYEPIQPRGTDWRGIVRKITAPFVILLGLAAKLGSLAKFAALFVAFGGYTLIWGWKFALGVIVLIFVHEMGHFLEAAREHLHPSWPVFIPFLGAYVSTREATPGRRHGSRSPARSVGGVGSSRAATSSPGRKAHGLLDRARLLRLLPQPDQPAPVRILDGAAVWRSTRWLWLGGGRRKAIVSGFLYAATALLPGVGAYAAYLPQHRL